MATLQDKIQLLIDLGFEVGSSAGFILSPMEDNGCQVVFHPPASLDEHGIEIEAVFKSASEMERFVDEAISYATSHGLIESEVPDHDGDFDDPIYRGLRCLTCGAKIISRHRHDFRKCNCEYGSGTSIHIDGGRDYTKVGYETQARWAWVPAEEFEQENEG